MTARDLITVYLKEDSPFYSIFPEGRAPVKSMTPRKVRLEGDPENSAYMLAWDRCSEEEKQKIAETIVQKFGGSVRVFRTYMDDGGDLPIRESQTVTPSACRRGFM